jgi:hypothetical protein
MEAIKKSAKQVDVEALRASPVHNLKPIAEEPVWVNISYIDFDPTNPGQVTKSLRCKRREPSIRDSYDILGGIIYPVVLCQSAEHKGRFIQVDGLGRLDHLKQRGEKKVRAYIYPPMTLEQRICFRETLNAAQEPFDAASIIQDLRKLAEERGLDIRNEEHVETLVRDLPEKVRNRKKDILILSSWHPDAIAKIGENYGTDRESIGLDQVKGLGRIMAVVEERHENTLKKVGGLQELSKRLVQFFLDGRFSEDGKSQQGIRAVVRSLKKIQPDDPNILKFFEDKISIGELEQASKESLPNEKGIVLTSCADFIKILLSLNTKLLTADEKAILKRTASVLNDVLSEVSD